MKYFVNLESTITFNYEVEAADEYEAELEALKMHALGSDADFEEVVETIVNFVEEKE